MDAKVISCILFVLITLELRNSSATIPGITVHTEDDNQKCTKKLVTCAMKIDDTPVIQRGEKGDRGIQGDVGLKGVKGEPGLPARDGEKGAKGENGDTGIPGIMGMAGEKGEPGQDGDVGLKGEKGELGLPGLDGKKGERGDSGIEGTQGIPGILGEKGEPGQDGLRGSPGPLGTPGPVGPPGIPGRPGICPCSFAPPKEETYGSEGLADIGTKDSPLEATCKFVRSDLVSGTYYMGPSAFQVYCNMTTNETCVLGGTETVSHDYNKGNGTFWLSEVGVDVKEIYGLTIEQIVWLQTRSTSVRQKLKYNCLNSVPYPKFNLSASMQLLTWNDVVIGPYPTSKSPLFYSVPPATDKCSEGSTEMQSTIIEMQSSNANRLPIADVWIGDVRGTNQNMSIESIELCFG